MSVVCLARVSLSFGLLLSKHAFVAVLSRIVLLEHLQSFEAQRCVSGVYQHFPAPPAS